MALAEVPAERVFFSQRPVFEFIEQRLPPGTTLVIPPDSARGRQVVTDAALRVAFAGVLDEFLAPPSTLAGKAGDLIGEVCRYRPEQTASWIAVATEAILRHSLSSAEQDLNAAVAIAIVAKPAAAGPVVREVLRGIDARVDGGLRPAPGRLDIESASRYASGIVLTAVNTVKPSPEAGALIRGIAEQALEEASARQASYLVLETMASLVKGGQGTEGARLGDLARLALVKFGRSKPQAGIICCGALKGAGLDAVTVIKDAAALNLPVPVAAYLTIVCNAYAAVAVAPQGAPRDISRFISQSNADYIPALIIGAITADPGAAGEFLQQGLNRDLVLHGRATTREIVEAAIMACEGRAPALAAAAVGHGDPAEGNTAEQIADGVARGAWPRGIAAALTAQIGAQGRAPAETRATVAGALTGAVAAGRFEALAEITFAIAAASELSAEVIDQAMVSAPPDQQALAICGVLAADRGGVKLLFEHAMASPEPPLGLLPDQRRILAEVARTVFEVEPGDRLKYFRGLAGWLASAGGASPQTTAALLRTAILANPRGAPACAALAAVFTAGPAAELAAGLSRGAGASERSLAQAMVVARRVQAQPASIFRLVHAEIVAQPTLAAETVTGALAAAPAQGHVVAQAAGGAVPEQAAQIVPRLFAFSASWPAAGSNRVPDPVALAGLTAAFARGVLESNLDADASKRAIAEVVAASLKSVAALCASEDPSRPAGAVIAAAMGVAGEQAPVIARAAARTLAGVMSREAIVTLVLPTRPAPEAARLAEAVAAGLADAEQEVPAPVVKGLLDYAHDSLTGTPMTRFHDL